MMTLEEFLNFAVTADGVAAIAGFLQSFCLVWIPGFAEADPRVKRGVALLTSLVVPLVAMEVYLVEFSSCHLDMNTTFIALQAGFLAYTSSQISHSLMIQGR